MHDRQILELALAGFELQLGRITTSISEIRRQLGIRGPRQPAVSIDGAQAVPKKTTMSAAARRRISLAQKKRWAAAKAEGAKAAKPAAKPKRKLSAAGRAAIIAATKKRWAAVHKVQKAAAKKAAPVAKKAAPKKTKNVAVKTATTPVAAAPITA